MLVLAMEFSRGTANGRPKAAWFVVNDKWPAERAGIAVDLLGATPLENGTERPGRWPSGEGGRSLNDAERLTCRVASASTGSRRALHCKAAKARAGTP
jgi:hypothetical protein